MVGCVCARGFLGEKSFALSMAVFPSCLPDCIFTWNPSYGNRVMEIFSFPCQSTRPAAAVHHPNDQAFIDSVTRIYNARQTVEGDSVVESTTLSLEAKHLDKLQ